MFLQEKIESKSTTGEQIDTSRIIVDLKVSIDTVFVLLEKKRVQFVERSTIRIIYYWQIFSRSVPDSFGRYFIPFKNS